MKTNKLSLLVVCLCLFNLGCEKTPEKEPKPAPEPYQTQPIVGLTDVDGVVCAEQSTEWVKTDAGDLFVKTNRAIAFFYTSPGKKPFLDLGKVELDTLVIDQDSEHVYGLDSYTKPFVFNSGTTTSWKVEGNEFIDFNGFSASLTGFPSFPELDNDLTDINRETSFTLRSDVTISNADYILFAIHGDDIDIYAKMPPTSTHVVFPSYEMQKLKKGDVTVEIAAINRTDKTSQTKKIAVINQSVSRKKVKVF